MRGAACIGLAALLSSLAFALPAHAVEFTVTRADDPAPPGPCLSNDCSLREAVRAANLAASDDIIRLPARHYVLTIPGVDEQAAATGDLDVTGDLAIGGAGSSTTAIDAAGLDRVFHVRGAGTDFTLVSTTARVLPRDRSRRAPPPPRATRSTRSGRRAPRSRSRASARRRSAARPRGPAA